jgi:hypothetical protein
LNSENPDRVLLQSFQSDGDHLVLAENFPDKWKRAKPENITFGGKPAVSISRLHPKWVPHSKKSIISIMTDCSRSGCSRQMWKSTANFMNVSWHHSVLMDKDSHPGEISFFLFAVHAFGVAFVFNLADWLILDWLIFCFLTPGFVVIPGSEGAEGYKNYWFHFRGFLIGTVFSAVLGLITGAIVFGT